MDWSNYQEQAMSTAGDMNFEQALAAAGLGLAGEVGEVADHIKKHLFHQHPLDFPSLIKEIGDVMWYVALLLEATGLEMDMILLANLDKLHKRYPGGFDPDRSINREEE